jgi:hypothetical protein
MSEIFQLAPGYLRMAQTPADSVVNFLNREAKWSLKGLLTAACISSSLDS